MGNENPPKRGDLLRAGPLNILADKIERLLRLRVAAPLSMRQGSGGPSIALPAGVSSGGSFYAQLTDRSGVAYGWQEVYLGDDKNWHFVSGGRTGTPMSKPAYEYNYASDLPVSKTVGYGEIVELHSGTSSPPDYRFVFHRIGAPKCTSSFCVYLGSQYYPGRLATITIEDPTGKIIATKTTTNFLCTQINQEGTYTILVTNYPGANNGPPCSYTSTYTVTNTCVSHQVYIPVCCPGCIGVIVHGCGTNPVTGAILPLAGATVTVEGGGSGTTNASGYVCINVPDSVPPVPYTVSVTAPYFLPQSQTLDAACGLIGIFNLEPDSTHVCDVCCSNPWPRTLTLTCDKGSCTLTYLGGGGWFGSMTWYESEACDGINTSICCPKKPQNITMGFNLRSCDKSFTSAGAWVLSARYGYCGRGVCPNPSDFFYVCCWPSPDPNTRALPRFASDGNGFYRGSYCPPSGATIYITEDCSVAPVVNLTWSNGTPCIPEFPASFTITGS